MKKILYILIIVTLFITSSCTKTILNPVEYVTNTVIIITNDGSQYVTNILPDETIVFNQSEWYSFEINTNGTVNKWDDRIKIPIQYQSNFYIVRSVFFYYQDWYYSNKYTNIIYSNYVNYITETGTDYFWCTLPEDRTLVSNYYSNIFMIYYE